MGVDLLEIEILDFFLNQRFELIKHDHLSSWLESLLIITHVNIAALLPPNLKHLDYNVYIPPNVNMRGRDWRFTKFNLVSVDRICFKTCQSVCWACHLFFCQTWAPPLQKLNCNMFDIAWVEYGKCLLGVSPFFQTLAPLQKFRFATCLMLRGLHMVLRSKATTSEIERKCIQKFIVKFDMYLTYQLILTSVWY